MPKRIWIWYFLAVSCWLGALLKFGPSWIGFVLMLLALGSIFFSSRFTHSVMPALFGLNLLLFLLASLLASFHGGTLNPISNAQEFSGRVEIVSDPRPIGRGIAFRVKLILPDNASAGNTSNPTEIRVEVSAFGQQRFQLEDRLTGEWVNLKGRLTKPPEESYFPIQARLQVSQVGDFGSGSIHSRVANGIRRNLERGAESLNEDEKAFYTGVIYGDNRNQSLAQRDLFRSTGLTHILAVSGQNVAFLLAIFYPLIRRLPRVLKLLAIVLVLLIFLTMTRFEPSVMRAVAMAITAFCAFSFKQDKTETRIKNPPLKLLYEGIQSKSILPIAVCILILITPSIVSRLAFQLSVLASLGIIFLSLPLARRLFGPNWLRLSLAVTISAQLAVAPLILGNFGALALGSIPANILALPAVALVTIWGMTAGLLAGVLGGAQIIHIPTKFLLGWIELMAKFSDSLKLGWLNGWHIALLFVSLALGGGLFLIKKYFNIYFKARYSKLMLIGLVSFTLISPLISNVLPNIFLEESKPQYITPEIFYWESQSLIAVKSHLSYSKFLSTLSQRQVGDIELLVFLYTPGEALLEALNERYNIDNIFVPNGKYIANTTPYEVGQSYLSERLILSFSESSNTIFNNIIPNRITLQVCFNQKIQTKQLSCYTL